MSLRRQVLSKINTSQTCNKYKEPSGPCISNAFQGIVIYEVWSYIGCYGVVAMSAKAEDSRKKLWVKYANVAA